MANARIQFSCSDEATWQSVNPNLREGELVISKKTDGKYKLVVGAPAGSAYNDSTVVWDEARAEEILDATIAASTAAETSRLGAVTQADRAAVSASNANTSATQAASSASTANASATQAASSEAKAKEYMEKAFNTTPSGYQAFVDAFASLGLSVADGKVYQTFNE